MNPNQDAEKKSAATEKIPAASDKSDGTGRQPSPSWWRDDRHGIAWEQSKQSVTQSWGASRRAMIDDASVRMSSSSGIAEAHTKMPAAKLNPSYGATQASDPQFARGSDSSREQELNLGGDEAALRYGVGAREEYGASHPDWSPELEKKLQADWQREFNNAPSDKSKSSMSGQDWSKVQAQVRHGYEQHGISGGRKGTAKS